MDQNLRVWFKDDQIVPQKEALAHCDHNGKHDDHSCP